MFAGVLPQFISVLLFSGLLLALLPPQAIGRLLGREAGLGGMLFSALVGAVALVPVMVVFPLVGRLLEDGAGIAQMAVFISTLTTVGVVTLPMEIRYWGKKAALLRNLLGLGSLMAFPGSMFGALLCGLTYHKAKQLLPTLVAEVFGTSILGGLCAYPVAILLMGKSAGDIAFYAYIIPFLVSTAGGAVIAGVLLFSLQRSGALHSMQASLT